MKSKTLVLLYGIVAVLILGVILAKNLKSSDSGSSAKFSIGSQPFSDLSATDIHSIELISNGENVNITNIDGNWVISERENYPANISKLQSLLGKIYELSITQSLEAGPSYDSRFGLGTIISLKDASGKNLHRLNIGKNISNASQAPMAMMMGGNASGCYIRLPEDEDHVYAVNTPISDASTTPQAWLSKDFLQIDKTTSILVSEPGALDSPDWNVSRPNSSENFTLAGSIPEGKEADPTILNSLKNLFSYGSFEDVLSKEAAEGLSDTTQQRKITITTEEGFIYTITLAPKTADKTSNIILTVKVDGEFPTKRTRPEAETVEEGKSADEYFASQLKEKEDRLAKAKELEGNYYEIPRSTLESLLKSRTDLIVEKPASPPQQAMPGRQMTAPIQFGR